MTAVPIDPSAIRGLHPVHAEAIDHYLAKARNPRETLSYFARHQRYAGNERTDFMEYALRDWWNGLLDLAELISPSHTDIQRFIDGEAATWFQSRQGLVYAELHRNVQLPNTPKPETPPARSRSVR